MNLFFSKIICQSFKKLLYLIYYKHNKMLFGADSSRLLLIFVFVALFICFLNSYSKSTPVQNDGEVVIETSVEDNDSIEMPPVLPKQPSNGNGNVVMTQTNEPVPMSEFSSNAGNFNAMPPSENNAAYFPSVELSTSDLLPLDTKNQWSDIDASADSSLQGKNFLVAGHHVGINTLQQSLRNANYGLRSEPPNPVSKNISPWLISTINPDNTRKPLEIGTNC